jgi:hypothetical protein
VTSSPTSQDTTGLSFLSFIRSNNFKDENKQNAINLFLGNYVPYVEPTKLWDLDSDYYLHNTDKVETMINNDFKIHPLESPTSRNSIRLNISMITKSKDYTEHAHQTLKSIQSPRQSFFEENYNQFKLDSFLTEEISFQEPKSNFFEPSINRM